MTQPAIRITRRIVPGILIHHMWPLGTATVAVFLRTLTVRIIPAARTANPHLGQGIRTFFGIFANVAGIFLQGQAAVRLSVDCGGIAQLVEFGILFLSDEPHLARNVKGKE
jgi:hypothetical protein